MYYVEGLGLWAATGVSFSVCGLRLAFELDKCVWVKVRVEIRLWIKARISFREFMEKLNPMEI